MKTTLEQLEEKIEKELKWRKIEDIPDFPLENFEEIKQKIITNEFSTGIDFTTSNQFAQWLYGKAHTFFFLALASTPVIVAILSIILAIVLRNYWLLIGIPIGFLGQFTSNPYNPSKNFFGFITISLFFVFVWALWVGKETIVFLIAFFIFPFWINRFIYNHNQSKLRGVALNSEKILIFLYQNGKLGLRDNSSRKMYWYREAVIKEVDQYLEK